MKALAAIRRSGGFLRIPLAVIFRSGLFGSFEFIYATIVAPMIGNTKCYCFGV